MSFVTFLKLNWYHYLGAVTTSAGLLWYLYRKFICHRYFKRLGIPGPEPHWFYGNLKEILVKNRHDVMREWSRVYGDIYGYYEGPTPILVVSSAEAIEQVCVKQFALFQGHRVVPVQPDPEREPDGLVNHLLFAQGERWKRLRTTVNPAFSTGKLKSYSQSVTKSQQDLMKMLYAIAEKGETFNIHRQFQFLTLDVIASVGFNVEFNAIQEQGKNNPVLTNLLEFFQVSSSPAPPLDACKALPMLVGPLKFLTNIQLRNQTGLFKSIGVLLDLVGRIMNLRQQGDSGDQRRNDILQLMLDSGRLDEREIKAMSFLFFVAGYETTSTTLAAISYYLASNPEVQEKLRQEIYSKFPSDLRDFQPDYDVYMHEMPYLDWVCHEGMRLNSLAFTIMTRFVVGDTQLCGIPVTPELGGVMVDLYSVHMNPDLWGPVDPKKFHPERFSADYETANRPDTSFLAFGYGPRQCVGMRLALFEMKLTLVNLLHRFRLEEPDGGYPVDGLPLNSREGFITIENGVAVKIFKLY